MSLLHTFRLPQQKDYILDLRANNYSQKTIKNYKRDLCVFAMFLAVEKLDFEEVNKKTITLYKSFLQSKEYLNYLKLLQNLEKQDSPLNTYEELQQYLCDKHDKLKGNLKADRGRYGYNNAPKDGLQPSSINRFLSALRSYLKFRIDMDYKSPLPPDAVSLMKKVKKKSQVPELEDLVALIEAPTEFEENENVALRNRAILETLFATGLRISELVSLNRDQINKNGKMYVIGKGQKGRFVYLTPRALEWIKKYLDTREDSKHALFIPYRGGRNGEVNERISTNYIQEKISEYRRKLDIIVPITPHTLRHGFATYIAEEGASPAAIQVLLGHASLDTTTRYVHASDKFAEQAHRKNHPLQD